MSESLTVVPDGGGPAAAPASPAGAAPEAGAPAPKLSPWQRRKEKLAEEERKRTERAAKRAAKESASASGDAKPAKPAEPVDEKKLTRSLAVFLQGLMTVIGLCAWPFGFRAEKLTREEALEDAEHWLPLGVTYRWFRVLVTWSAAPFLFMERIGSKLKPRKKGPPAP